MIAAIFGALALCAFGSVVWHRFHGGLESREQWGILGVGAMLCALAASVIWERAAYFTAIGLVLLLVFVFVGMFFGVKTQD